MTTSEGMTLKGYYNGPEIAGKNIMPPYSGFESEFYYIPGLGGDGIIKAKVDTEPDIFYYSFPGSSGKFIIDKSRGAVLFNKSNNVKIEIINRYTTSQLGYYFKITTTDGTQYIFDKEEKTTLYSDNKHLNKNYTIANVLDRTPPKTFRNDYTSAWNLSKIILPNKKEILFTYTAETITTPAQESLRVYYKVDGTQGTYSFDGCTFAMGGKYSTSKSSGDGFRLSKITWDGGYIDFIATDRLDLNGTAKALSSIKVYNKSNTIIRQFGFEYSYFNDNYSNTTQEKRYIYMKLKLNRVYENSEKGYRFSYFEGTLPAKNSKNTDYWGYYNNGRYGANYCAKVNFYPRNLDGVLKNSDLSYLKIGTLNRITLPTGGNVSYDYEENTFGNTSWAADNINRGAGLRVKQITTEATTRNFTYTGGKLLVAPALYHYDIVCPPGGRDRSPNCVVQLSEPKLPLSSFSNGNTVGYDKVEEYIGSTSYNSKTAYEFYNEPEEELYEEVRHDFPTIPNYYNGLPNRITMYENRTIVETRDYRYASVSQQRVEAFRWDPMHFSAFNYSYQPQTVRKTQEIIRRKSQNLELLTTNGYTYNSHYQPASSTLTIDAATGESQEQVIYYPTDFTDNISRAMVNAHLLSVPVETIGLSDGLVVSGKKTVFKQVNGMFLPDIVYTLDTDIPRAKTGYSSYYNPKLYFDSYDNYGNPISIRDNKLSIVYLWGYYGMYPVAEIKNATYDQVKTALGATPESLSSASEPNMTLINSLRTKLPGSQVTTFTYKPLVGTLTATDPRGVITNYEYDSSGRLILSKDHDGKAIQRNYYNYRTQ